MSIPPRPADTTAEAHLRAARELHQPSVNAAGEYEDGTCAYCMPDGSQAGVPPLDRFRDYLNGRRTKVWMHSHTDQWPVCNTCAAGYDDRADFPCATAVALGWDPFEGRYI